MPFHQRISTQNTDGYLKLGESSQTVEWRLAFSSFVRQLSSFANIRVELVRSIFCESESS